MAHTQKLFNPLASKLGEKSGITKPSIGTGTKLETKKPIVGPFGIGGQTFSTETPQILPPGAFRKFGTQAQAKAPVVGGEALGEGVRLPEAPEQPQLGAFKPQITPEEPQLPTAGPELPQEPEITETNGEFTEKEERIIQEIGAQFGDVEAIRIQMREVKEFLSQPDEEFPDLTRRAVMTLKNRKPEVLDDLREALGIEAIEQEKLAEPGFLGRIGRSVLERGQAIEDIPTDEQTGIENFIQKTGQSFGALSDVVGEVVTTGLGAIPGVKEAGTALLESDLGKEGLEAIQTGQEAFEEFAQENPRLAKNIVGVLQTGFGALELTGAAALRKPVTQAIKKVGEVGSKTGKLLVSPVTGTVKLFNPTEKTLIAKSVRPTVRGKRSAEDLDKFFDDFTGSAESIVRNKDKLQLTDDVGNVVEGALPETLIETSQAISQTKKEIFKEFDGLIKKTGAKGVEVRPTSIFDELNSVQGNKAIKTVSPETIEYANTVMKRFEGQTFTPQEMQDMIKIFNQRLEAFYNKQGGTIDDVGKSAIDSLVVNKLRKELDTVINSQTGENFQLLKNKYGQLSSIEKEVGNRALVDARKNSAGLGDFLALENGADLAVFFTGGGMASLASATGRQAVKKTFQFLNDPNRQIKQFFKKVDKRLNE